MQKVLFVNLVFFLLTSGNLLVNKTDLRASYLSGTYCRKTGTRPPSCNAPRKPTMYASMFFTPNKQKCMLLFSRHKSSLQYKFISTFIGIMTVKKEKRRGGSISRGISRKQNKKPLLLVLAAKNEKINNWTEKNNNNRPFSDLICEK